MNFRSIEGNNEKGENIQKRETNDRIIEEWYLNF